MFEANIDLSFYIKLPKICQKQDKNQSLPSFCSMDSNHAQRIGRHFILRQICHRDFFLHRTSLPVGRNSGEHMQRSLSILQCQPVQLSLDRNRQQVDQLHNHIARLAVAHHRRTDPTLYILTGVIYLRSTGRYVSPAF